MQDQTSDKKTIACVSDVNLHMVYNLYGEHKFP